MTVVVPSMWLERRPDVAQAEREVAQQSAMIAPPPPPPSRSAAILPGCESSGVFGYASTAAGGLITASNKVWSGAVSGSQCLFDGGRAGRLWLRHEQVPIRVLQITRVVLSAFGECGGGCRALRVLAEQAEAEHRAAALSRRQWESCS